MIDKELLNKLKKEAETSIPNIVNNLEDNDCGAYKKEDLVIKFDRFEIHLNQNGDKQSLIVRYTIYVNDNENYFINSIKPIGYYETIYDLEGNFIDDFFVIQ